MIRTLCCLLLLPTMAFAADGQTGPTSIGSANIMLVIPERIGFAEIKDEETGKTETIDISTVEYTSFYVEVEIPSRKKGVSPKRQKVLMYMPEF